MNCCTCAGYHEMNLDWLIAEIKNALAEWNITKADWEETKQYITDYFKNLNVTQEISDKLNQMAADGSLYDIIKKYTDPIVNEQDEKISVLKSRMDTFASLTDGSTTGDAELKDIRVGYNGVIYPTAGDAVRGQVGSLSEDIINLEKELNQRIQYYTNDIMQNYNGWKEGYYYSVSENSFKQLEERTCTDFLKIEPKSKWYVAKLFNLQFFDYNKSYIGENPSVGSQTPVLTTFPDNAEWVIVTILTVNKNEWKFYPEIIHNVCKSELLRLEPKNYKKTLIESNGDNIDSVVDGEGVLTLYNNSNVPYHTKRSILAKRILLLKGDSTSSFKIRLNESLDISKNIGIWIYCDDKLRYATSVNACTIRYHYDSEQSSGFYRYKTHLKNGWNFINVNKNICALENGEPTSVRYISFYFPQVTSTVENGKPTSVIFLDSVILGYRLKPTLAITYDAMWADSYENGIYDWHENYSVPCNVMFTDFNNINGSSFHPNENVSSETLKKKALEMNYVYGFELGAYGGYGDNASGVRNGTDVDTVADLIHGNQNVLNNELSQPCTCYSCSQGVYNSVIENAIKQCDIKIARTTIVEYIFALDKNNVFVGCNHLYANETADSVITWIDNMIDGGFCGVLFTHAVSNTPTEFQANITEWNRILNHINEKKIAGDLSVMNISEMAEQLKD